MEGLQVRTPHNEGRYGVTMLPVVGPVAAALRSKQRYQPVTVGSR